ncbi:putative carboxylesterase 2 [Apostasia shenzhenica]|uniref:Putative carboxylesterase 2 n=1 Tax=Apostasia shenzhenica TaxID=1088818 RepID=A0A2I0A1S8_9ASPA|nr:putative carboxylesterase 2 [Apostasia shenzhenica]
MGSADTGDEIIFDLLSMIHVHRSGRVERFEPTPFVPPSFHPATGVDSKDVSINSCSGLSARLYLPLSAAGSGKLPVVVFFHGGGFFLHRAASSQYHDYLNSLAACAGAVVVSVDYRLAPEYPLPAAYDDSWEALQWVSAAGDPWLMNSGDLDRVFLAGDSAGGNIVHNLGMRLGRGGRMVNGIVMMNPFFWGKERIGAERKVPEGAIFRTEDVDRVWPFVCPGSPDLDDQRINPTAAGAAGLAAMGSPRILVSVGSLDLLLDRGIDYCEKMKESGWGGEVEFMEVEGEDHGFFLLFPGNERAAAFMETMVNFVCKI